MRKWIALAISLVLLLGTVSGVFAEGKEAPVGITIAYVTQPGAQPDQQKVYDKINEILLRDCNIFIEEVICLDFSSYYQQMNLMLASSEKLDVFACNANYFPTYINNKQLMELDDLLENYGQDIISAVGRDYLNAGIYNGHQYGLTTNRDLAQNQGFLVNKDLCDANGIDLTGINTLEGFEAALAKIQAADPTVIPFSPSGTFGPSNSFFALSIGCDPLGDFLGVLMNRGQDEELKVVNLFETEEYMNLCKYFYSWYNKGYTPSNALTETEVLLNSGLAFSTAAMLKPGVETERTASSGRPIVAVPVTEPFSFTTLVQSWQWCIPSFSEKGEAAMKFLNKMYGDPEVTNLMVWGIEGEHYVFTEDGHITYPEGVTLENTRYRTGAGWEFGNQYNNHIWEGDSLDLYTELKQFNDSAIKSKAMGFAFNSEPVKSEFAACKAVLDEYQKALEYGVMNPETGIPAFVKKLQDSGIDKIIAEKQAQLDAWLAAMK